MHTPNVKDKIEQKPTAWLVEAFKHNGLKEIKGKMHNKTILLWLKELKAWWSDDEAAWCSTFVAWCLKQAKRDYPKHWYRALEYQTTGMKLDKPAYGSIAVIKRKGGGHVFFVVGKTKNGDIVGYGGNQSDAVNLRVFAKDSIIAYRWPALADGTILAPNPERYSLPVYGDDLKAVTNMA